jgi:uncharacterized lipoprotein
MSIFRGGCGSGVLLAAAILAGCGKAPPAGGTSDAGQSGPAAQTAPTLQWPPHFSPPLEIRIAVPQVPAKIRGPSPPIDEKKT